MYLFIYLFIYLFLEEGISPTELWGLPLSKRHPQISIHFCETGHKECRNDYMKPFHTLSLVKKVNQKHILGVATTLPWADEG